jgi:hypothetical protein
MSAQLVKKFKRADPSRVTINRASEHFVQHYAGSSGIATAREGKA